MRLTIFTILCAAALCLARGAFALELVVTADVPANSPSLTTTILKFTDGNPDNDPWTDSTPESTIEFGDLTYLLKDGSNAGSFYSRSGYCVVIFVEPFGKPFNILAGCTGVSDSAGNSLPVGSFGMRPVYSDADKWVYPGGSVVQGSLPAGASLGSSGPAVPGGLVYSSESGSASARIVQLYLSLAPYAPGGAAPYEGYVPVPLTQPPGRYTATVTLTLEPK